MKKLESQRTLINPFKLPKINTSLKRKNFNPKNIEASLKNDNNKINNNTCEIKKQEIFNNNIDDIIIEVNKKFNISSKVNTSLNNETKKENMSSFFVNDFSRKNFFIRKNNKKAKENTNLIDNYNLIVFPRITKTKLEKIKSLGNKILFRDRKENIAFKKLLEDYSEKENTIKKNKENIYNLEFQIKVNKRKVLSILEDSGIIEAYDYLINNLKPTGWPKKSFYEYSPNIIKGYKNKFVKNQIRKRNEIVEKYLEDRNKYYTVNKINEKNNIKLLRVPKEREANIFIKKLDKSRSTLNIISTNKTSYTSIDNNTSHEEIPTFKCSKVNVHFRNNNKKFNLYNYLNLSIYPKRNYIRNIKTLNNIIIKNKSQTNINNINKEKLYNKIKSNKNSDIAHLNITNNQFQNIINIL